MVNEQQDWLKLETCQQSIQATKLAGTMLKELQTLAFRYESPCSQNVCSEHVDDQPNRYDCHQYASDNGVSGKVFFSHSLG